MKARTLDSKAIAYIQQCLQGWGSKSLSKFLLQRPDLQLGTVTTFLPETVSIVEAYQFEVGGKLPPFPPETHREVTFRDSSQWVAVPVPSTKVELKNEIKTFIRSQVANPMVIFEDGLARREDPCVKTYNRVLFMGSEVYHVVIGTDSDVDIEGTMNMVAHAQPPFVGAMTSLPSGYPSHDIPENALAELAERALKLVVGAYDGEGFLLWTAPLFF